MGNPMNKPSHSKEISSLSFKRQTAWLYDVEPYIRIGPQYFDESADAENLGSVLKRAVASIETPQYLIEAIKREIRK